MKTLKSQLLAIVLISSLFACKKDSIPTPEGEYIEGYTRIVDVKGNDSSSTTYMHARTETVGLLMVEDAQLKAELMSYTPLPNGMGQYVVKMTNKQSCQVILRWMWEGLTIDNISPPNDVLAANQAVTFTLIGDAKPGRIKVKAEKEVSSNCSNSSTLILEITTVILPVKYTQKTTKRVGDKMIVEFTIDDPSMADWFFIMWTPDGRKENEVMKGAIMPIIGVKKYTYSFPAVKKSKEKTNSITTNNEPKVFGFEPYTD